MPPQASNDERYEKKVKGVRLTKEIRDELDKEANGNQTLIIENLLRMYYDKPSFQLDEIKNSRFNR